MNVAEPPAEPGPSPAGLAPRITPKALAVTPKALAGHHAAPVLRIPGSSVQFGRADASGRVFVRDGDGEREVGAFPGATETQAVQYFARKYDELFAHLDALAVRLTKPEVTFKEASEAWELLRDQTRQPMVVGDLAVLRAKVSEIELALNAKQEATAQQRLAAKEQALAARTALVQQAEQLAAVDLPQVQWKSSTAKMRELLDEWKGLQRAAIRLDKKVEDELWHRFSRARNSFDKARRAHFAELDKERTVSRSTKESLVGRAEELATSTDWAATASEFKHLMEQWRKTGRVGRNRDEALWERFREAQDQFFVAKDAQTAAQDEQFRANLRVKEDLLAQAQALLPVGDQSAAKAALRSIQDKWEAAGKVPRVDIRRMEDGLRAVERAIRDNEERTWREKDPELNARAQSMRSQLVVKIEKLQSDLLAAEHSGNPKKVAALQESLTTHRAWLQQVGGSSAS